MDENVGIDEEDLKGVTKLAFKSLKLDKNKDKHCP